jgi:hypothetical protein
MADNNGDQSTDRRNLQAEGIRVIAGDGSRLQDILSSQLMYTDGLYPAYPSLHLQALSQGSLERNLNYLLTLVVEHL